MMKIEPLLSEIARTELSTLAPSLPLTDIAQWDSLKMVRLVIRIEEMVGRELTEDELSKLETVGDVGRLIGSK